MGGHLGQLLTGKIRRQILIGAARDGRNQIWYVVSETQCCEPLQRRCDSDRIIIAEPKAVKASLN